MILDESQIVNRKAEEAVRKAERIREMLVGPAPSVPAENKEGKKRVHKGVYQYISDTNICLEHLDMVLDEVGKALMGEKGSHKPKKQKEFPSTVGEIREMEVSNDVMLGDLY